MKTENIWVTVEIGGRSVREPFTFRALEAHAPHLAREMRTKGEERLSEAIDRLTDRGLQSLSTAALRGVAQCVAEELSRA